LLILVCNIGFRRAVVNSAVDPRPIGYVRQFGVAGLETVPDRRGVSAKFAAADLFELGDQVFRRADPGVVEPIDDAGELNPLLARDALRPVEVFRQQ
jgi:hypothetical protein